MSAPFVPVPEVIVGVLALGTALQRSGRDLAREGIRTGELSCETGRCFQPTHPFFLRPRLPAPSGDVGSSLHSKLAPSSRARPPPPPARGSARLTAGEGRSQQHARGGPGPGSVQALAGARSLRSAAAMSADPVVFVAAVRTAIGEGPGDGCSSGAGCPRARVSSGRGVAGAAGGDGFPLSPRQVPSTAPCPRCPRTSWAPPSSARRCGGPGWAPRRCRRWCWARC